MTSSALTNEKPKAPVIPPRSAWLPALAAGILAALSFLPAAAMPEEEFPPPEESARAEEIRETVEIYMLAKMKRELDLTREQEEKVIPLVQDLSEARSELFRERRATLGRLRPLTRDPEATDEELTEVLERLHAAERSFREKEASVHKEIRSVLSPRQQAQFIFFQERFQSEMRRKLRRMREMRGPGPGGPDRPGRGGGRRRNGGGF